MQVSTWGMISFYIWLVDASVIMVATAWIGAQKQRPELCLVVEPLLVVGIGVGVAGGPDLAVVGGLAAMWLPLLGVTGLPARTTSTARAHEQQARARGTATWPTARRRAPTDDPYTILGLSPGASRQEIKEAWLRRAVENHPDKVAHLGVEASQAADETMAKINAAYETLRRSAFYVTEP